MLPALVAVACMIVSAPDSSDLPIGHVTPTSYGDWVATGTAFRLGPAHDELLPKLEIKNALDNAVISSEREDDPPTGALTSPSFNIERKYIAFRIGGGDYEYRTCLNLVIGGKIVRSATGRRSDTLYATSWDVRRYIGQAAHIVAVDEASGDWGHINVDHIMQTDHPEQLPVSAGSLYREALRPQFHFTARQWTMERLNPVEHQEGWVNDLNGLIYYDGEYHLFAQRWATCWLHAVSKDLVHWTELQPAFWEESLGSGVQSGTCVIDYENTSGLSPDKSNPAMVAFWPRFDNRSQCIDYSLDHGRTWKRYDKNPILTHPERDPKVFWYAPGRHWVMILYGDGAYNILSSPDLLNWKDEHHPIPNSFECPDFFELPIDGHADKKKWVLIQGNGNYSIGSFDGKEFKEEGPRHPCDIGPNFYATQSWANTETGDGRRIQAAWVRGAVFPEMPFNQMISFPCELSLQTTPAGLRVFRKPIKEIASLHSHHKSWNKLLVKPGATVELDSTEQLARLKAEVSIPPGAKLTFQIRGETVVLTSAGVQSGSATGHVQGEVQTVELLVDRASIETFVNHGEVSSTRFALMRGDGLSVSAEGGPVSIRSLDLYSLKSAWPQSVER